MRTHQRSRAAGEAKPKSSDRLLPDWAPVVCVSDLAAAGAGKATAVAGRVRVGRGGEGEAMAAGVRVGRGGGGGGTIAAGLERLFPSLRPKK